jgi:hypothetical protein
VACKDYVRSAASAVLATNRVLLAPFYHDSGSLRLQVPPCRCIDFHPERRPRTPNGPATIDLAPTSRNSIFRTVTPEPRATRLSEAAPPQSRTHVSRVIAPTHQYLTQTRAPASFTRLDASRRPLREAAPLGLARVARPRPRACRRLAPRERRTTRGELATSPRRQPPSFPNNALRRRRGEGAND